MSSWRLAGRRPVRLDPLVETWPRARPFLRCHHVRFGATEFNPGLGRGRFHAFPAAGTPVPVLYAAGDLDGALSETVFHNVPVREPGKSVSRAALLPLLVSTLIAERDLRLAQLHGHGLTRLGLRRADLIDSEADRYAETAAWAQALHADDPELDGLVWISRQHDTARALVLFGDRVRREDLAVEKAPMPLFVGRGFAEVERAAERAGIVVME